MRKSLIRKAFTLVELLVVIAILAVLGTVGVIGYTTFVNKAQLSNDASVISELNTFIKAIGYVEEINTVQDADRVLEDSGFDLNKLNTSTKGYRYAYDIKQKEFCLIDKEWNLVNYTKAENKVDVFAFLNDPNDFSEGSAYLSSGYSAFLLDDFNLKSITTSKGIDTGNNAIANLFYTNDNEQQNVVIRTNGGNLTVNSKVGTSKETSDEIVHYGYSNLIDIHKTAQYSYYEKGAVAMLLIKEGHVVLTNDSDVFGVHFEVSGEKDSQNADTFKDIKLTFESSVNFEQIDFSRDHVVINTQTGTKVCEVELNQDNSYIYLFKDGIYEQIKVSPVTDESNKEWVTEAPVSDDTKNLSFQIANNLGDRTSFDDVSSITPSYSDEETRELADKSNVSDSGTTVDSAIEDTKNQYDKKYAPSYEVIDIVFAFDNSKSNVALINFKQQAKDMLTSVYESFSNKKTIKVGVVQFKGTADSILLNDLVEYNLDTKNTIETAIDSIKNDDGSNLHSGLLESQKILEEDTEVPDVCKFLILFTDGKAYCWTDEKTGETKTIYGVTTASGKLDNCAPDGSGVLSPSQTCGQDKYQTGEYGYYNSNDGKQIVAFIDGDGTPTNAKASYTALFNSNNVELTGTSDYETTLGGHNYTCTISDIVDYQSVIGSSEKLSLYGKYYNVSTDVKMLELNPYEVIDNGNGTISYDTSKVNPDYFVYHVSPLEKALYKAGHTLSEINKKYNCGVVCYEAGASGARGYQHFIETFMDWMEGPGSDYYVPINSGKNTVPTDNEVAAMKELITAIKYKIFDLAKIEHD